MIFKLQSIGVGGLLLNILKQFLFNRQQRVAVDGFYSSLITVRSGVPQGSVLGPLLFIIFTADMWCDLKNNMIAYADDSTLYAVIKSPSGRLSVAESLNQDLSKIESLCNLWGTSRIPPPLAGLS